MILVVAEDMKIKYGSWVKLYQSRYFQDEFPEDNKRFQNVTYTEDVEHDQGKSLVLLRERMFAENRFKAAVFIGGMGGVLQEFELFKRFQPSAALIPVASTGGAALELAKRFQILDSDLSTDLDYVAIFHRHLGISVREERFAQPDDQPAVIEDRYWRPPTNEA